jgi:catechol 2,3-dioxygenase-like lactoylglutathione lyase family enzyme
LRQVDKSVVRDTVVLGTAADALTSRIRPAIRSAAEPVRFLPTEVRMSSTEVASETTSAPPKPGEMRLEGIPLPVSDIDRAKEFYEGLGWRLDADLLLSEDSRVVQFTPPGSGCSIQFGTSLTSAEPGSAERLEMAVYDIDAAREDLIARGVEVSEPFHFDEEGMVPGPDPQRSSYKTLATFNDPDGNGYLLQEITERLPGR